MTPIRLLLVDDEQGFVEALTRRLVSRDYQVAYVLSGEEALRFLDKDKSMDVVLLDVKMPGLDGLETLRRIKALQPLVETIMLTAHATIATRHSRRPQLRRLACLTKRKMTNATPAIKHRSTLEPTFS